MELTREAIAALPKVVLHDHLDGGLLPGTIVELAGAARHALPAEDPDELGRWFVAAATSGNLAEYLETFTHTVAVMQTAENLRRVAREAVETLAADGVVYAEQRYAPEQHLAGGLTMQEVVDAVAEGLAEGTQQAAAGGRTIRAAQIVTALRQGSSGPQVVELALANRDRGVVGFDLAGIEAGFPPSLHEAAFRALRAASFPVTCHAGEGAGLESIAQAVHLAGALRLGHGVRITDDIAFGASDEADRFGVDGAELGRLAHWVRDNQIPLELCPTSNVQTGAATSVAEHSITALAQLGFAVTINPDNRLMSGTSMTQEMERLVDQAGWTLTDLRDATLVAARSAFCHYDQRAELVDDLAPGFTEQ